MFVLRGEGAAQDLVAATQHKPFQQSVQDVRTVTHQVHILTIGSLVTFWFLGTLGLPDKELGPQIRETQETGTPPSLDHMIPP